MSEISDQYRKEIVENDKVFKQYVIDQFEKIKQNIPLCEKEIIKKELKLHLQLIILILTVILGLGVYIVQSDIITKLQAKEGKVEKTNNR